MEKRDSAGLMAVRAESPVDAGVAAALEREQSELSPAPRQPVRVASGRAATSSSARLTTREGRKFGLSVGTAFLMLCGVLVWRGHDSVAVVLAAIGAALILAGLLLPTRLGPIQRTWMRLAYAISRVTTPLAMGIIYYLVLTPAGVLRRGIGANPVRHSPRDGSYWAPRPADRLRSDLQRQF